jgi:hypothetical protein
MVSVLYRCQTEPHAQLPEEDKLVAYRKPRIDMRGCLKLTCFMYYILVRRYPKNFLAVLNIFLAPQFAAGKSSSPCNHPVSIFAFAGVESEDLLSHLQN